MIALLLAALLSTTGIARTVDADLTAIAEQRVVEISACAECFTHAGQPADTWEVLAFTTDADPAERAVELWMASAEHAAILTDASLTRIGCASRLVVDAHYFACELLRGEPQQLPDAAIELPIITWADLSLVIFAVVCGIAGVGLLLHGSRRR
jgi:hypothetical protein